MIRPHQTIAVVAHFGAPADVGARSGKSVSVRLGRATNDSQLQSMIRQIRNPIEFDMKIRIAPFDERRYDRHAG